MVRGYQFGFLKRECKGENMSRIFIDGIESGSLDLWDSNLGGVTASTTQKYSGSYAAKTLSGSQAYLAKGISSITAIKFKLCFYLNIVPAASYQMFLQFGNADGAQMGISINPTSLALELRRGTTLVASGTKVITTNNWYQLEGYLSIANAGGIGQLRLNGIASPLEIDFSGDTQEQAANTITLIKLGNLGLANNGLWYFDDMIFDTTDWVGNTRIQAIIPNGAGTNTNWTPSAGANYECVNEIPPSDTDYVETNINDILDTYACSNLSGTIDNIKCVQIQARCIKEGDPTPENLQLAVRSGGADYVSGNKAVPSILPVSLFNIWETDPNTSLAWTVSGVNDAEIGQKAVA